jgi:hypothetical protein
MKQVTLSVALVQTSAEVMYGGYSLLQGSAVVVPCKLLARLSIKGIDNHHNIYNGFCTENHILDSFMLARGLLCCQNFEYDRVTVCLS